jgi:hypothetical protein
VRLPVARCLLVSLACEHPTCVRPSGWSGQPSGALACEQPAYVRPSVTRTLLLASLGCEEPRACACL